LKILEGTVATLQGGRKHRHQEFFQIDTTQHSRARRVRRPRLVIDRRVGKKTLASGRRKSVTKARSARRSSRSNPRIDHHGLIPESSAGYRRRDPPRAGQASAYSDPDATPQRDHASVPEALRVREREAAFHR
jgi:hypothetical protein